MQPPIPIRLAAVQDTPDDDASLVLPHTAQRSHAARVLERLLLQKYDPAEESPPLSSASIRGVHASALLAPQDDPAVPPPSLQLRDSSMELPTYTGTIRLGARHHTRSRPLIALAARAGWVSATQTTRGASDANTEREVAPLRDQSKPGGDPEGSSDEELRHGFYALASCGARCRSTTPDCACSIAAMRKSREVWPRGCFGPCVVEHRR